MALSIDGEPRVGVVHAPFLQETYTAIYGAGAFCNGQAIRVSRITELRRALGPVQLIGIAQAGGTAQDGRGSADWALHNLDLGNGRFSPLDEINTAIDDFKNRRIVGRRVIVP